MVVVSRLIQSVKTVVYAWKIHQRDRYHIVSKIVLLGFRAEKCV